MQMAIFKDGKFGFYNNSQENTVYGNVRFIRYCPLKTELIALNKTCKICWTLIELNKG